MKKFAPDYLFVEGQLCAGKVLIMDDDGIVLEILDREAQMPGDYEELSGILSPGFVNCHCHLELSHLKGKFEEKTGLTDFIRQVQTRYDYSMEEIYEGIEQAEQEMYDKGIVAVGDISNTDHSFGIKAKGRLHYHSFLEIFNIRPEGALESLKEREKLLSHLGTEENHHTASLTAHAPYSVSKRLFGLIAEHGENAHLPLSIHNQETKAELELFYDMSGDFREMFERFGIDLEAHGFEATGKSSLQSYLPWIEERAVLLIHNTFTTESDIDFAKQRAQPVYWCFCPNANLFIEDRVPDFDQFIEAGVTCVLGTDSLASNWQLDILEEIKVVMQHSRLADSSMLLRWATQNGAQALGQGHTLGTLKRGFKPGLVLIDGVDQRGEISPCSKARRLM